MIISPFAADLPVVQSPLPFELANRQAIDAYWEKRLADNPRLWNGPFFLFTNVACHDGLLTGQAHPTDFATFLYYRHVKRDPAVTHITGTSLMVTKDNAVIAMEMAAHTANAGRRYFPAGSFDAEDIVNGRLDAMTNVRRELAEEVGLTLTPEDFAPAVGTYSDNTWYVALRSGLPMTFDDCEAHFRAHQAETGDDELARLVPVRQAEDAAQLLPFAQLLSKHALGLI